MKNLKTIIENNLDMVLFSILLTIKMISYGKQIEPDTASFLLLPFPVIGSVLLICSIILLFKRKNRVTTLFVIDLILSVLFIADVNYYRYFKDIPTLAVVKNGILLGPVKSSVSSLFKVTDLLFLIDLVVFLFVKNKIEFNKTHEEKFFKRVYSFAITFALGFVLNFIFMHQLSVEQPKLITTMFNRVYIAKKLGIVNAHGIDIYNEARNTISRFTPIEEGKEAAIETFLQNNSGIENSNLKGEAKGKNLIMIQVEALQQFVIGKSIDGQEITPNLNRWIKKSAYFNNFFYQVASGGTSDAELMTNNSLYPSPSGAAYYQYPSNEFNSLSRSLKKEGYSTAAFHGFKSTFWNRDVMYKNLGFDQFFSERDFNIDDKVGLGLSDKSFLSQSLQRLETLKQPYYSFLITLSSHFPFDDKKGYGDFPVGEYEGKLLGNYIRAVHYTDEALGEFLDNLEKKGILDNSIVVLYGDHYAISKDNESDLSKFLGISNMDELQWAMLQKVPMFIHFPQDKHSGTYKTFAGEMDVYPTLNNLFSLKSENTFGKDLFNSKDGNVIFRNGSFTDGNIYYSSASNTYYDIASDSIIKEDDTLKSKKEYMQMQLEYSDEILKHDLLKKYNKISN